MSRLRSGEHERFVKVARLADIPDRRSLLVSVGDEQLVLWNVCGRIFAVRNLCPHQHFSALHEGTVDGTRLTCPMHGWTFSLEDGSAVLGSGRLKTYQVKVEKGEVYVERPAPSW